MGTYDTRGGAPISPHDDEPGSAEIELTAQEWEMVVFAVGYFARNACGNDIHVVEALAKRLEELRGARHAFIQVWGEP